MSEPGLMKVQFITYNGSLAVHPEEATLVMDRGETLAMRAQIYRLFGEHALPMRVYEHKNSQYLDSNTPLRFLSVDTYPGDKSSEVKYCEVPLEILKQFNLPLFRPSEHDAVLKKHSIAKSILEILATQSPHTEPQLKEALKEQLKKSISDSSLGKALIAMRGAAPPMIWNKRSGKDRGYRLST
jgi:hypothetical protein